MSLAWAFVMRSRPAYRLGRPWHGLGSPPCLPNGSQMIMLLSQVASDIPHGPL